LPSNVQQLAAVAPPSLRSIREFANPREILVREAQKSKTNRRLTTAPRRFANQTTMKTPVVVKTSSPLLRDFHRIQRLSEIDGPTPPRCAPSGWKGRSCAIAQAGAQAISDGAQRGGVGPVDLESRWMRWKSRSSDCSFTTTGVIIVVDFRESSRRGG